MGGLPAALASGVYLECRLAPGAGQVDVILRVEREGAAVLAGRNPAISLPEPLSTHPAWAGVANVCGAWMDGLGAMRGVDHLWIEFDLDPHGGGPPAPSVFVGLEPRTSAAGWTLLLEELAERLLPGGLDPETARALRRVLAASPPGVRTPYLGFMLARPGGVVRVYFAGVPEGGVPGLLEGIGWPASTRRLMEAVSRTGSGRPRISMVHVDVAGEVLPRVGIEYALLRRPQLRGVLAEAEFLDGLVESGLSGRAKREALGEWPGRARAVLPHELWPSLLVRRVNCVKLLYDDPGRLQAKAYLLASRRPR